MDKRMHSKRILRSNARENGQKEAIQDDSPPSITRNNTCDNKSSKASKFNIPSSESSSESSATDEDDDIIFVSHTQNKNSSYEVISEDEVMDVQDDLLAMAESLAKSTYYPQQPAFQVNHISDDPGQPPADPWLTPTDRCHIPTGPYQPPIDPCSTYIAVPEDSVMDVQNELLTLASTLANTVDMAPDSAETHPLFTQTSLLSAIKASLRVIPRGLKKPTTRLPGTSKSHCQASKPD